MISHKGENLDSISLLILESLSRQDDHRLNTSEAKTLVGEDNNDTVRRRFERLDAAGLVTLDEDESAPTQIPPKRATLTDEGVEKAENWDARGSQKNDTIEKRLERIEAKMNSIDQRMAELEHQALEGSGIPELLEARRLVATLNDHAVGELDADLGKYYPSVDE